MNSAYMRACVVIIAVDIEKTFKLGSGPNAKTTWDDINADLAEIDSVELLNKIEEKYGFSPDDLAFIWFSPPCETNSSMNRVNESRDTEKNPVTWHRHHKGAARDGPPGDLARKHDVLVLR